jgi:DNA-binding response OmpR family regulator/GGDEF domain-containing protein
MTLNPLRQNIHKGRLLVIDADHELLRSLEALLARQGYEVVGRDSWPEAHQVLLQDQFDLVLSDLQAGQGRGEGTAKTLLALGETMEVMIGVPLAQIQEGRAALQYGATAYLLQPYDHDELRTLVDRSLFRHEEAARQRRLGRENSELRGSREVLSSCLPLLQVDDLDRLGDLVLDTLMELCAAEAGLLWLSGNGQGELQLHSRRGLSQLGPVNRVLVDLPESFAPYPGEASLAADRRTLSLPLYCSDRKIGLVRLEAPVGREIFSDADLQRAATAVTFAAVALSGVLRRQEVEKNLLRAPGSQAYNMTFFRDHLEKELYAAKRYDRKLALLKVVIANYGELLSRFHDRQVTEAGEKIVATIMTVLRDTDLICSVLPGQFYVLLPETDSWGALMAQRRMRKALRGQLLISDMKKNLPIQVQMRSATAPLDATTLPELDRLLEARLALLRRSLLLRGQLEEAGFWTIVDTLLAAEGPQLLRRAETAGAAFLSLAARDFTALALTVCQEIIAAVPVRGVILWGSADLATPRAALCPLLAAPETRTALYLLGAAETAEGLDLPGVTIPLGNESLGDKAFLLCLGEDYAYALLARRDGDGWHAFHSDDSYFVENMLAKLQEQYQFQAQI